MENIIEVENISYTYPDGISALKNISFKVKKDEILGIIGPNGAGKTTLLLALCGLIPIKGDIWILEQKLTSNNSKKIRKNIGLLFQDPDDQLFTPTVFEDVAFGPKNLGIKKEKLPGIVSSALEKVGLQGFENRSSHHLSFGEKKRVSLATILATNPKIFLLDEPTSNLDPKSRKDFINLIKNIPGTKIIASCDLEMIKILSDRIILLNKGEKTIEDKPEEILDNTTLLEQNDL